MEQFKTVEKWFANQACLASSDPYQDLCDNYSDFIKLIKTYTDKKQDKFGCCSKPDKMKEVLENIIVLLQSGYATCPNWLDSDGVAHFCYVYNQIKIYKQDLIDHGYNFHISSYLNSSINDQKLNNKEIAKKGGCPLPVYSNIPQGNCSDKTVSERHRYEVNLFNFS